MAVFSQKNMRIQPKSLPLLLKCSFVLLFLLFFSSFEGKAQTYQAVYQPGEHFLQIGIGWPNSVSGSIAVFNTIPEDYLNAVLGLAGVDEPFTEGNGSSFPQLQISYDYGLEKEVSFGPYFGWSTATTPVFNIPELPSIPILLPDGQMAGRYSYKIDIYSFGIRALYHQMQWEFEKIDMYAIGIFGINYYKIQSKGVGAEAFEEQLDLPTPSWSGSAGIGGRIHFSDKLGMYFEAGYGVNYLNLGLVYRLNKRKQVPEQD